MAPVFTNLKSVDFMKPKSGITLCLFLFILIFTYGCKKDDDKTVTDIDGNVYKTITIGGNVWMAENLRTTKFRESGLDSSAV